MKIELKQRITHNGVLYDPGVHDLPADLCEEFMAKGRWVAAPLQKIKLIHPIIHDGTEYGRGIHELPESLVAHFLTTASHAAVALSEESTSSVGRTTGVPKARPYDPARGSIQKIEEPTDRPRTWKDVEITFLSEFRLQIRNGAALNYAELGFADTRGGNDKPNTAWVTFRKLAESRGRVLVQKSDPKRPQLEKQIQQIRTKLREYFGIEEDPLPFIKDETHVGYRTEFKVSCSSSYDK